METPRLPTPKSGVANPLTLGLTPMHARSKFGCKKSAILPNNFLRLFCRFFVLFDDSFPSRRQFGRSGVSSTCKAWCI